MWTTIIPLVRSVIAASILVGSMHQVSGSTSTNTGTPPTYFTAFAVAMYVSEGTMTSSPGRAFSANSARWRAIVPLQTVTEVRVLHWAANSLSNLETNEPVDDIQDERIASTAYLSSLPVRSGYARGIRCSVITPHCGLCRKFESQ